MNSNFLHQFLAQCANNTIRKSWLNSQGLKYKTEIINFKTAQEKFNYLASAKFVYHFHSKQITFKSGFKKNLERGVKYIIEGFD